MISMKDYEGIHIRVRYDEWRNTFSAAMPLSWRPAPLIYLMTATVSDIVDNGQET